MTRLIRDASLAAVCLLGAAAASAQAPAPAPQTTASSQTATASDEATRPATTTFYGDTGIWFVPTAEVLAKGKVSASGYRRGTNYIQGYTNVGDFAGTFAFGVGNRAEIFGSFLFDTRIDRDVRPTYGNGDPSFSGIVDRYPFATSAWSGDHVGDFYVGAKVNLMSEADQKPAAAAIRGMIKLPTGDKDAGTTTGKADGSIDFIVSKEAGRMADVSGFAGYEFRGKPDGFSTAPTGAFRYGAGFAVPSRSPLRGFIELNGVVPNEDKIGFTGPVCLAIGVCAPSSSNVEKLARATFGVTGQAKNGFFAGVGIGWNVPTQARNLRFTDEDQTGDYWDWQVRIGFHPGVRVYVAPPPPPPLPPPPPAPQNRAPTVKARCEPCTVEVGKSSTVTADAQDPDGDTLTYRWSAPAGTLQAPADRQTLWTAPQQEGPVPVTVTVDDGKGGTANDSVTIQVVRPPKKDYVFEDVHFDFDRYSLRPEALRVLDEAISALNQDATLRITIEGHTCNIGTAEYNLALGERRANAVRDYLTSRGISTSRLNIVSYGEERPKYDNAREETRRLNRRAAMVVRLQ